VPLLSSPLMCCHMSYVIHICMYHISMYCGSVAVAVAVAVAVSVTRNYGTEPTPIRNHPSHLISSHHVVSLVFAKPSHIGLASVDRSHLWNWHGMAWMMELAWIGILPWNSPSVIPVQSHVSGTGTLGRKANCPSYTCNRNRNHNRNSNCNCNL